MSYCYLGDTRLAEDLVNSCSESDKMNNRSQRDILGVFAIVLLLSSCGHGTQESRFDDSLSVNTKGRELMMSNCVTCHSPSATVDNRLAPPMFAIQRHYIEEGVSLEEFKTDLEAFLLHPSEVTSKMPGAVRKFGFMPKMGYSQEQISDVADYIYHTDMEAPDWFEEHYAAEHDGDASSADQEVLDPTAKGLNYALATKSILGKNLMGQITAHGTEAALGFCNERAIHLTDSMSSAQEVKIKRVSDKPRNPDNRASAMEAAYILSLKQKMAEGEDPKPSSFRQDDRTIAYYPITTNAMCLQCHGVEGENITVEVKARIEDLYPADEATGYGVDELRGIWVVEMEDVVKGQ